jgi:hypothetical protein
VSPPSDELVKLWEEMQTTPYFTSISGSHGLTLLERSAVQNGLFLPVWIDKKSFDKVLYKTAPIAGRTHWQALPPSDKYKVQSLHLACW